MRKLDIIETQIARLWNRGLTVEQATDIYGAEVPAMFTEFEAEYDSACVPRELFHGFNPAPADENIDPEYLAWKGVIGPGAQLRKMLN